MCDWLYRVWKWWKKKYKNLAACIILYSLARVNKEKREMVWSDKNLSHQNTNEILVHIFPFLYFSIFSLPLIRFFMCVCVSFHLDGHNKKRKVFIIFEWLTLRCVSSNHASKLFNPICLHFEHVSFIRICVCMCFIFFSFFFLSSFHLHYHCAQKFRRQSST